MRSTLHKSLTLALLAAYAGVMLIGEGLHALIPGHYHLHGQCIVSDSAHDHDHGHCDGHHSHSACCHDHTHDHNHDHNHDGGHGQDHAPAGPAFAARTGDYHSHACDICAFLYQTYSQTPQLVATPDLHLLVAELPVRTNELYTSAILGLHSARGPPQPNA